MPAFHAGHDCIDYLIHISNVPEVSIIKIIPWRSRRIDENCRLQKDTVERNCDDTEQEQPPEMKRALVTKSADESAALARRIGMDAVSGDIIALYGELGTGKTVFAKGIAQGMGIREEITSPTFTLLEVYEHTPPLYHFDLYRIEEMREFELLGFDELWYGDGVSVIEWADRAGDLIPEGALKVRLFHIDGERRRIEIEYPADRYRV